MQKLQWMGVSWGFPCLESFRLLDPTFSLLSQLKRGIDTSGDHDDSQTLNPGSLGKTVPSTGKYSLECLLNADPVCRGAAFPHHLLDFYYHYIIYQTANAKGIMQRTVFENL